MVKTHIDTYALPDSGTNQTFCSEQLVDSLCVPRKRETISLTTLDTEDIKVDLFPVNLNVSDISDTKVFQLRNVMTRPTINVGLTSLVRENEIKKWSHLSDIILPDIDSNAVHLVIGQYNNTILLPERIESGQPGEPYAVKTPLGWVLNGPIGGQLLRKATSCFIQADTVLQTQVEKLFRLDDMVPDKVCPSLSINDQKVNPTGRRRQN